MTYDSTQTLPSARPLSEGEARDMLSGNIFGHSEWRDQFYIEPSIEFGRYHQVPQFPWDYHALAEACPFTRGKTVAETHYAFLGLPSFAGKLLTIAHLAFDMGIANPRNVQRQFYLERTCGLRWYLMPKVAFGKPDKAGFVLAKYPGYEVSDAVERAFMLGLARVSNAGLPFSSCVCWEDSIGSSPMVAVTLDIHGLVDVYPLCPGADVSKFGLALSRKLPAF